MGNENEIREIKEAIDAGRVALGSLGDAYRELQSASRYSIADILGMNLIGGIGKHVKISKAKDNLERARMALQKFSTELRDVHSLDHVIDIGDFWTFTDFFFDGLFVDIMVQSKISQALSKVSEAQNRVAHIIDELQRRLDQLRD